VRAYVRGGAGVILRDLTFIEDGNQDWLESGDDSAAQINVEKLRMIGQVLLEVAQQQAFPINYSLLYSASPLVLSALRAEVGVQVPEHSDDILYDLSLKILPTKQAT